MRVNSLVIAALCAAASFVSATPVPESVLIARGPGGPHDCPLNVPGNAEKAFRISELKRMLVEPTRLLKSLEESLYYLSLEPDTPENRNKRNELQLKYNSVNNYIQGVNKELSWIVCD